MKKFLIVLASFFLLQAVPAQESVLENLQAAITLNDQGEYEKSLVLCNLALDENPEIPAAWFLRGYNNYHLENYKDAIIDFTVAINFNPDYAEAWFYRGKAKQENGDVWGGLKDLNRARELDSSKSVFLLVKGFFRSVFSGSDEEKNNPG